VYDLAESFSDCWFCISVYGVYYCVGAIFVG
jgi:hypothetical protein